MSPKEASPNCQKKLSRLPMSFTPCFSLTYTGSKSSVTSEYLDICYHFPNRWHLVSSALRLDLQEVAHQETQKYKEGMYVLERDKLLSSDEQQMDFIATPPHRHFLRAVLPIMQIPLRPC